MRHAHAGIPDRLAAHNRRYASEWADVLRLRSLLPLGGVELDLLVLIQRPVTGARDRGEVDEHVRRPVIGGDETKALVGVEPLHCSCCHQFKSSVRHARRDLPRRPRAYRSQLWNRALPRSSSSAPAADEGKILDMNHARRQGHRVYAALYDRM